MPGGPLSRPSRDDHGFDETSNAIRIVSPSENGSEKQISTQSMIFGFL
jgi:hypothetical protein